MLAKFHKPQLVANSINKSFYFYLSTVWIIYANIQYRKRVSVISFKANWVVLKRILRGHVTIITISSSNHWQPPLIISHHFGNMSILIHLLTINYDTIAKNLIFSYRIELHGTRDFVVIESQNARWNLPTLVTFTWMGKRCCVVLVVFSAFFISLH